MNKLELKNISKSFNKSSILDNISAVFEDKKIYGLLGTNGAGKTTLLNLISGKYVLDQGAIFIDGQPAYANRKVLQKIYLMGSDDDAFKHHSIMSIFKITNNLNERFQYDKAMDLSEKFSLDIGGNYSFLSMGDKTLLRLIVALSMNAEILLFDEPTQSLDLKKRELFYQELIKNYLTAPKLIIVATHLFYEMKNVFNDLLILDKTKVRVMDSIDNLQSKYWILTDIKEQIRSLQLEESIIYRYGTKDIETVIFFADETNTELLLKIKACSDAKHVDLKELFMSLTI